MIVTIPQVRYFLAGVALGIAGEAAFHHVQVGRALHDVVSSIKPQESGFVCVEHKKQWRCEDLPEVVK